MIFRKSPHTSKHAIYNSKYKYGRLNISNIIEPANNEIIECQCKYLFEINTYYELTTEASSIFNS